ncbi:hypothetical protein [Hydrocoleum sp. CS-953]|uniref:hypothetical protein n=1 Tax=Hydrocoleum sp. CS-953 TaxID=1671698 RepID=UPI00143D1C3A|nr:hypothetical protein [Hydrocoleum sp. CS-953]
MIGIEWSDRLSTKNGILIFITYCFGVLHRMILMFELWRSLCFPSYSKFPFILTLDSL